MKLTRSRFVYTRQPNSNRLNTKLEPRIIETKKKKKQQRATKKAANKRMRIFRSRRLIETHDYDEMETCRNEKENY